MQHSPDQLAEQFINHTNRNVFLTGKAGTGKTTFLKHITRSTHKRTIVTAPTGIAALNAGGVTLHSQFQLPFGGFIPEHRDLLTQGQVKFETKATLFRHMRMHEMKRKTIRQAELLIIDEVSMLRADILDAIDFVLQTVRRNKTPFGGLQVLFIGDLLQLPPVVRNEEWDILQNYYDTPFFFGAQVLKKDPPVYIELEKIYRQEDKDFTDILNNLRYNKITDDDVHTLNRYCDEGFQPGGEEGYITLTTHNRIADQINQRELSKLESEKFTYKAKVEGEYPEHIYPCEYNMVLKEGAQVMFIKNDISGEKRFYNGKIGVVAELSDDHIIVKLEDGMEVDVEPYVWENIRYSTNDATKEIEEDVIGSFTQYPLRLAWAITIHKSQGLTFEKAAIDVRNVFAAGQSYVAFSRLRSLKGLVLSAPLNGNGIANDQKVIGFENTKQSQGDPTALLKQAELLYLQNFALAAYDFSRLVGSWRYHLTTYTKSTTRSEKQKHFDWAEEQLKAILNLKDSADKFIRQLRSLFAEKPPRLLFIEERLQAAKKYYEQPLKDICSKVFMHKRKMGAISRTKTYLNELEELDASLLDKLQSMHKLTLLIDALYNQKNLQQSDWKGSMDMSWRDKLMEVHIEVPERKKKREKGETQKETFRLYAEGKKIPEIAKERNLTPNTIETHFAKLISQGQINISDIMDKSRLEEMLSVIRKEKFNSLTDLKPKLETYSYGEIKMALAHLEQGKESE